MLKYKIDVNLFVLNLRKKRSCLVCVVLCHHLSKVVVIVSAGHTVPETVCGHEMFEIC
jgi:hypothetical protein